MSEGPWIRFFPSDWLAGTRGMTAAETGIYVTLIAMMYERGEPIPNETSRLARLCGTTTAALKSTLAVLMDEGKISLVDGGLWNDRVGVETEIRRDKSTSARESAETRWRKKQQNQSSKNANAMQSQCDRNANQIPDTRKKRDANASLERDAQFAEIWSVYPRKVGKAPARRKFDAALKVADFATIKAGVERYAFERQGEDPQFTKHLATWLHGCHWQDEPAPPKQVPRAASPPERTMRDVVSEIANGTYGHAAQSDRTISASYTGGNRGGAGNLVQLHARPAFDES